MVGETVSGEVGVPEIPLMEIEVALETDQVRVVLLPALMMADVAAKLLMTGAGVTGLLPVALLPPPQPMANSEARLAIRRKARRASVRYFGIFSPKYEQR